MPIYEYACRSCEHTLDALQKIGDAPLVDCPECGKPELKKLLSAPRFRLKGEGWYETDFKKENRRNVVESGEGAATKPDAKPDSKPDAGDKSTPAKKSEPAAAPQETA